MPSQYFCIIFFTRCRHSLFSRAYWHSCSCGARGSQEGLKYYGKKEVQLAAGDKSEDMQAQKDSKLVERLASAFADVVQTDHDFFSTMQQVRNERRQLDIARTAVARARKDLQKQQDIENDIVELQSKWKLQAAVADQHWHARNTTVLRIRVLIRQKYLALKYECLQVQDANFNFCDKSDNPTYDCLNDLRRAIDEEYKKCKDARSQSDKGQQQVALNLPLDKTIYDEQTRTASFCLRPPNLDLDEQCQQTDGDKYSANERFYYDVRLNSVRRKFYSKLSPLMPF